MHGHAGRAYLGDGEVPPGILAEYLRRHVEDRPIFLISCDTATGPDSFAQLLADDYQQNVVAATTTVWINSGSGRIVAT